MKKFIYWFLTITWGLIMSTIGILTTIVLLLLNKKPIKYGPTYRFEIGDNWGGITLGFIVITSKNPSKYILRHEFGHTIQNILFGPFMVIIAIMSFVRCQYFTIKNINDGYYNIWFESQASKLGTKYEKEFD